MLANLPWIVTLAGIAGLTAYAAVRAFHDGIAQQAADNGEGRADGLGDREVIVDLPRGEARTLIRALAAAIGDGRERTFTTESARG